MAVVRRIDELVERVSLHIPRPGIFHGTVFPFIIIYGTWTYIWLFVYGIEEFSEAGFVGVAVIGLSLIHI